MLDIKTQSHLMDATAAMMRSCFTATTNTWAASAYRGLSLWAEMLGAGSRRNAAAWSAHALDWSAWSRISVPAWSGCIDATAEPAAVPVMAAPTGFASYRSDGGHAVAQIASPVT